MCVCTRRTIVQPPRLVYVSYEQTRGIMCRTLASLTFPSATEADMRRSTWEHARGCWEKKKYMLPKARRRK